MDRSIYAEAFLRGQLRIATLGYCRTCEDAGRGDRGEAIHQYFPGYTSGPADDPTVRRRTQRLGINMAPGSSITLDRCRGTYRIPDAFVLCMTERPDSAAASLGDFCVEITSPMPFFHTLTRAIDRLYPLKQHA